MNKPPTKINQLAGSIIVALLMMLALALSGFTIANLEQPSTSVLAPAPIPALQLANVIRNGDFEQNPRSSIATHWEPYDNGQAHFGWYAERWPEAVHSGQSSQLMEIFEVFGYAPNRVMAIYQTIDVVPNANYQLTIHALMRSDAPAPLRNKGDYAMRWGVDYSGRGKYDRVEAWVTMPLTEQLRLGSAGPADEAEHLFFQRITGTIFTGNSNKISLFITGEKVNFTGTEVNFNVDDVSLVGPYPVAQPQAAVPAQPVIPAAATGGDTTPLPDAAKSLPNAGTILSHRSSPGLVVALGSLVLVVLGLGATWGLMGLKN